MVDKVFGAVFEKRPRGARQQVIGVLGMACMAKGLASTKAEGNLKKRNEIVDRTLESQNIERHHIG